MSEGMLEWIFAGFFLFCLSCLIRLISLINFLVNVKFNL